jgi:hypothetical protein
MPVARATSIFDRARSKGANDPLALALANLQLSR